MATDDDDNDDDYEDDDDDDDEDSIFYPANPRKCLGVGRSLPRVVGAFRRKEGGSFTVGKL